MVLGDRRRWMAVGGALVLTSVYVAIAVAQDANGSGEVRRVDVAAGKVTIKHGAISDLQLPAMILVYHIDPVLLADIKPGDKVKFTARREAGQYVVTKIEKS